MPKTEAPRAKGVEFAMAMAWVRDVAGKRRAMGAKSSCWEIGMLGFREERRVGAK